MLDLFGDDYIAEHIEQQAIKERRERIYRQYVTDALYCISSHKGQLTARWVDIDPAYRQEMPKEDPDELQQSLLDAVNEGRTPINESI